MSWNWRLRLAAQAIITYNVGNFVGAEGFGLSVLEPCPFPSGLEALETSTLKIRLPNSLHRQLRALAQREGMSMNQFISSAVGEKLAALMTEDYLARAGRGGRKAYDDVLRAGGRMFPREERDKLLINRMQRRPAQAKKPRRLAGCSTDVAASAIAQG